MNGLTVISDSTPLINFSAIDHLDLLQHLFECVIIPEAVYRETTEFKSRYPLAGKIEQAIHSGWIQVRSVQGIRHVEYLRDHVDWGEAEALTLYQEIHADKILLDETEARGIAKNRGMTYLGTIGCLILAKQRGLIFSVQVLLNDLREKAHFWIRQDLYQRIVSDFES